LAKKDNSKQAPPPPIVEKEARRTTRITAGRTSIYSNSVDLAASPFDLRLRFGQMLEANDEEIVIQEFVEVFMSPQHARVFIKLLTTKLADYERQVPGWGNKPFEPVITEGDEE